MTSAAVSFCKVDDIILKWACAAIFCLSLAMAVSLPYHKPKSIFKYRLPPIGGQSESS